MSVMNGNAKKFFHLLFQIRKVNFSTSNIINRAAVDSEKIFSKKINEYQFFKFLHQNSNKCRQKIFLSLSIYGLVEYFSPSENNSDLYKEIKIGQSCIENGNLKEAARILANTLEHAEMTNNEDVIFWSKKLLADIALKSNQYGKAEELIKGAIEEIMKKELLPPDDKNLIYMKLKLAEILEHCNNHRDANTQYNQCISTIEPKINNAIAAKDKELLVLWIDILQQYSDFFHKNQNSDEALNYLKKAYEVSIHLSGDTTNEQTISILEKLGKILFLQGNLDDAGVFLKQAANIGEKYAHSRDLSTVYTYLGNIYLKKGLLKDAMHLCDKALDYSVYHRTSDNIAAASVCLMNVSNAMA